MASSFDVEMGFGFGLAHAESCLAQLRTAARQSFIGALPPTFHPLDS